MVPVPIAFPGPGLWNWFANLFAKHRYDEPIGLDGTCNKEREKVQSSTLGAAMQPPPKPSIRPFGYLYPSSSTQATKAANQPFEGPSVKPTQLPPQIPEQYFGTPFVAKDISAQYEAIINSYNPGKSQTWDPLYDWSPQPLFSFPDTSQQRKSSGTFKSSDYWGDTVSFYKTWPDAIGDGANDLPDTGSSWNMRRSMFDSDEHFGLGYVALNCVLLVGFLLALGLACTFIFLWVKCARVSQEATTSGVIRERRGPSDGCGDGERSIVIERMSKV